MPNWTMCDYEGPFVAPRVQAALDAALKDRKECLIRNQSPTPDSLCS